MNYNRKKEINSKTTISVSPGKAKLAILGRTIGLDLHSFTSNLKKRLHFYRLSSSFWLLDNLHIKTNVLVLFPKARMKELLTKQIVTSLFLKMLI